MNLPIRSAKAGFEPDLVARLQKAVTDLREVLDDKAMRYGRRSAATAGLLDEVVRGRELVRMLDDMVRPGLVGTPDKLAEWRTLSRFFRKGRAPLALEGSPNGGAPGGAPGGSPSGNPNAAEARAA